MITYEDITKAQEGLKTLPVEGKDYVMVNERIKAFRKLYPDGFIITQMLSNENGICVFEARVGYQSEKGELNVLATGTAYEKEDNGYINKTSYIENCETSAVGRALGFLGIGIDTSIASFEEVANAVEQQTANEKIDATKANALIKCCERENVSPEKIAELYKVKNVFSLTEKMYSNINSHWNEVKDRCGA